MSDVSDLKAEVLALRAENSELRKHVKMPDEPLEIDEKDFYVRAFIKWATEEQPEVKRLEAENEMLRKELAVTNPLFETLNAANDRLIYENMKLRELVRDMWQFTGAACKRYPRLFDQSAQGGQMVMPNMLDSFERRMRELGIEVDA